MQSTLATFFKPFMMSAHLIDCRALIIKKNVTYILFSPNCSLKITLKYLPPLPILGGDILCFRRRGHNNLRVILTPFSPTCNLPLQCWKGRKFSRLTFKNSKNAIQRNVKRGVHEVCRGCGMRRLGAKSSNSALQNTLVRILEAPKIIWTSGKVFSGVQSPYDLRAYNILRYAGQPLGKSSQICVK